jgi:hypothetical protein
MLTIVLLVTSIGHLSTQICWRLAPLTHLFICGIYEHQKNLQILSVHGLVSYPRNKDSP